MRYDGPEILREYREVVLDEPSGFDFFLKKSIKLYPF